MEGSERDLGGYRGDQVDVGGEREIAGAEVCVLGPQVGASNTSQD